MSPTSSPPPRLHHLDGIRGWAALVVLAFHLLWETFGQLHPVLRTPAWKFVLDGPLAVYVFFILSGDALSSSFLRSGDESVLRKLVLKRYFRLAGPIFLSCLLVWTAMRFGLTANVAAGELIGRQDWLGAFLHFDPSLHRLLDFGLMEVFTNLHPETAYNPFLWPMAIELFGSFALLAYLFLLQRIRRPLLASVLVAVYLTLLGSYYALFFVGLSLAMLRQRGAFERRKAGWFGWLLVALAVVVDALLEMRHIERPQLSIVLATMVVGGIYLNASMVGFFSNRLSRYLGRISFPLYLSHFVVLATLMSGWIVHTAGPDKSVAALGLTTCLAIAAGTAVAAIVVAELFTRIEKVYLNRLRRLADAALVSETVRL